MVKFVNYNGVDYPIRVSYYALKKLKEKLGRGLSITDDGTDYAVYETLLYYALEKGHKLTYPDEPFPFVIGKPDNPMDMENVMDSIYTEFMKIVPQFFTDGNVEAPELGEKKEGGEDEKKQIP